MTRPRKQIVDYFPHFCNQGKTMFIIEQAYGNDGYAFWFKLLEMLATTEGHCIDMNKPENVEFLVAKTRIQWDICGNMLNKLATLSAIDPELWEQKIIWSDNFVANISDVYRKRSCPMPIKPDYGRRKSASNGIMDAGNPQSKVKESKGEKSKVNIAPEIIIFGSQNNVKLTNDELTRLTDEFPDLILDAIEFLSLWLAEKGDKSKSKTHNATIRRWVIDAVREKRAKRPKQLDVKGILQL